MKAKKKAWTKGQDPERRAKIVASKVERCARRMLLKRLE